MASIKRRLSGHGAARFRNLSAMQDRCCTTRRAAELLDFLTVQVSELFRDPGYFRAIRERVVPHLKTYPSLKVWVAGCSAGEELYSFAILFREEGLEDRTLFYGTDINPGALESRERHLRARPHHAFTENHRQSGGKSSLSDYYTAAYGRAVREEPSPAGRLFRSQPGHRCVFAEVQLISCRNVLIYFDRAFQDRAIGLFKDSLTRKGFWASARRKACGSPSTPTRLSSSREEGSTKSEAALIGTAGGHRDRRLGGAIEALSTILPRYRPTIRSRCWSSSTFRPTVPTWRPLSGACQIGVREAEDKEPFVRGAYFAPPDYHLLGRGRTPVVSGDEPVHFSRPSIDVLFESAADAYGGGLVVSSLPEPTVMAPRAWGSGRSGRRRLVQSPRRLRHGHAARGHCALPGGPCPGAGRDRRYLRELEVDDVRAGPINFLLVDDLEENLLSLEGLLHRDGLVCSKRAPVTRPWSAAQYDVALALLDVQMPGMDGFELAELMRGTERTRHVPIIFLTAGTADRQRRFRGYEAGAVDFIQKPIEPDILRSKANVSSTSTSNANRSKLNATS